MINIFNLWENFIGEANTFQGGHVKPQRQFVNWVNVISKDIFNELVAQAEIDQRNNDLLSPFLKSGNIFVTQNPGQFFDHVLLPPDYEAFSTARIYTNNNKFYGKADVPIYKCKEQQCEKFEYTDTALTDEERSALSKIALENLKETPVKKVGNSRWSAALQHENLKPTVSKPICTQYDKGLKIAPKNITVIVLDYYRLPKDAVFNYSIANPGTETEYISFVSSGSEHLEWSPTLTKEFIARLKVKYGDYTSNQQKYVNATAEVKTP